MLNELRLSDDDTGSLEGDVFADDHAGTEDRVGTVRRIDDLLEVETRVKDLGGASVTLTQTVLRDGQRLFEAEVVLVLVAVSGKPLRLSAVIRAAFGHQPEPTGG